MVFLCKLLYVPDGMGCAVQSARFVLLKLSLYRETRHNALCLIFLRGYVLILLSCKNRVVGFVGACFGLCGFIYCYGLLFSVRIGSYQ